MIQAPARLGLCLACIAGLAACDTENRSARLEQSFTAINLEPERGILTPEALSRAPFLIVVLPDKTASIWRADGEDAVTVGIGEIGSGLHGLGASLADPLRLYAQHDAPALQMIEIVRDLNEQGFSWVALVTAGGWTPPIPEGGVPVK